MYVDVESHLVANANFAEHNSQLPTPKETAPPIYIVHFLWLLLLLVGAIKLANQI